MPNAYYLKNRRREPDLSIDATTVPVAATAALTAGEYTVYCKEMVDFFVCTGASWNSGNCQRVLSGNMPELIIEEGDKILAKTETGTATLEICKIRNNIYY